MFTERIVIALIWFPLALIALIFLLQYALSGTLSLDTLLTSTENPEAVSVVWRELKEGWTPETVFAFWGPLFPVGVFIGLIFAIGVVYCGMRVWQIRQAEWAAMAKAQRTITAEDVPRTHLRWHRVLEHSRSNDEHKWRLAILEADIMLDELLDLQGYKGATMTEKMKTVPRSQFNTIDDAWEAHQVRNRVAHEGAEKPLSEGEKNYALGLYERVFKEFGFI